jgi:S1-C subfamily serine protease
MSAAFPRRAPALLAAGLAAVALAACNGSDEDSTQAAEEEPGGPPKVVVQTQNGFNAQEVYADASPGVVTIRSVFNSDSNGSALGGGGQGSGFVISEDGEVATNAHVVTDGQASGNGKIGQADEVYVEFSDRNQVPAEVVGFDPNADTALLEIDPDGLDLEPLDFGDSDAVSVGTPVAAIGSPFGQEQSLSLGIVSATDRGIESLTQFLIGGAIQTDASINPGNSGGPLIDASGKVIGVNQQINTTSGGNEGVGFAVPSNLVKRSIEDLRDDGKAEYAFIGVTSVPLYPQLADELGIDAPTGSLIVEVTPDSPADKAGLRGAGDETIEFQGQEIDTGGDVIVAVEGEKLVAENDLARLISTQRPGDEITVEILRDGDRRKVKVTLEPRPQSVDLPDPEPLEPGGGGSDGGGSDGG